MATFTIEQIARVALNSGWSGEDAAIATAIAMAESSGNTSARGDTTIQTAKWGPSIGLWQIRSLKADRGTGRTRDELANLNPNTNGKHAYEISGNGTNWVPWSVFTNGRYRAHLPQARMAVGVPGDVPDDTNPEEDGGLDFGLFTDGGTWARVGLFVLGGGLSVIALYRATGAGKLVATVASSAVQARTGIKL